MNFIPTHCPPIEHHRVNLESLVVMERYLESNDTCNAEVTIKQE